MAENERNYDKARDLTEKALDAYVERNEVKGDELVEKAKATNEQAVRDVNDELNDDAGSQHDPKKLNQQNGQ
jgi:F0F1-type ATP synthase membrane subunit b/b'